MRQVGTVKFFDAARGYGFIRPADGTGDIFVHSSALRRAGMAHLNEGQRISFELEDDQRGKGPKAVNLELT
jgi:CspA family cold shock protein